MNRNAKLISTTATLVNQTFNAPVPFKGLGRGPTLSFKEVVDKYGLNASKLRANLRHNVNADAPVPVCAFPKGVNSAHRTYYNRAEITKWVTANLEKLK